MVYATLDGMKKQQPIIPGMDDNKTKKVIEIAEKILRLSKDHLLMHMRFVDVALSKLQEKYVIGSGCIRCDGEYLYYDPVGVIESYKREPGLVIRMYLHVLFHMIFSHAFGYEKLEKELWDLSCDMAVEYTAMELDLPGMECREDLRRKEILSALRKEVVPITAEKLYRYYRRNPLDNDMLTEYASLFRIDDHGIWNQMEQMSMSLAEWKKLSERIRTELKSFSGGKSISESLEENLREATKEHVDYTAFLKRFAVSGEIMHVNEDEFDYIYYDYGFRHYGNMPLIEPLEYVDEQKVHDFVIAIDTSASCRGQIVKAFLDKTYAIMKTSNSFFEDMNVHIIQCDHEIQEDALIRNQEDFDRYLEKIQLRGFGATDYRPVFEYVDDLIAKGEIKHLKGLLYFTDGYGMFPGKVPDYETVFVFLHEDYTRPQVPSWAVEIVLDGDVEDEY